MEKEDALFFLFKCPQQQRNVRFQRCVEGGERERGGNRGKERGERKKEAGEENKFLL